MKWVYNLPMLCALKALFTFVDSLHYDNTPQSLSLPLNFKAMHSWHNIVPMTLIPCILGLIRPVHMCSKSTTKWMTSCINIVSLFCILLCCLLKLNVSNLETIISFFMSKNAVEITLLIAPNPLIMHICTSVSQRSCCL